MGPNVSSNVLHVGRRFRFEQLTITRSDGNTFTQDIVRHPGSVVVLPVLPDGRYVLIRNRRWAIDRELWELCAGTLESSDRSSEDCARRELEEETGYRGSRMRQLGAFYTTPGLTDEYMRAFVATGLERSEQDLDDTEEISVAIRRPEEVRRMILDGELVDAKSMLVIMWYERLVAAGDWVD